MSFVFLGTGTSGNVPIVSCFIKCFQGGKLCSVCDASIKPLNPQLEGSSLQDVDDWLPTDQEPTPAIAPVFQCKPMELPRFGKNRRRNTSGIILYTHPTTGESKTVLIDCGKTFYDAALQWFLAYKICKIDAVLLTHSHADAILGLDDLRQFTGCGTRRDALQSSVPIFCTKETFGVIEKTFGYLVDTKNATGGGEVAALDFHIIDENGLNTIHLDGLDVDPFYGESVRVVLMRVHHGRYANGDPYLSLGFRWLNTVYISDMNHLPEASIPMLKGVDTLIIDALRDEPHASHLSIQQAIDYIVRFKPKRAYFTGMTHSVDYRQINTRLLRDDRLQALLIKPINSFFECAVFTITTTAPLEMTPEEYVVNHVLRTAKGDPLSVVNAIDTLCHSDQRYSLMNVGDDKGAIVDRYIQQQVKALIHNKMATDTLSEPIVMVEIGGYIGYSAIRFSNTLKLAIQAQRVLLKQDLPAPLYYSFEVNPQMIVLSKKLITFAGLDKDITVIPGAFSDTLPAFKQHVKHADIFFIDHWKDLYLPDMKAIEMNQLLISGSMLIADNTVYPGTPDYLEYVRSKSHGSDAVYRTESVPSNVEYIRDKPDALEITIKL